MINLGGTGFGSGADILESASGHSFESPGMWVSLSNWALLSASMKQISPKSWSKKGALLDRFDMAHRAPRLSDLSSNDVFSFT